MESLDDQYLAFTYVGICALIPVSRVCRISLQEKEEKTPLIYLEPPSMGETDYRKREYQILLECGEEVIRMAADEVLGIRQIAKEEFIRLEKPLINDQNKYLKGAVPMELEDGREFLAFLADPEVLWEIQRKSM